MLRVSKQFHAVVAPILYHSVAIFCPGEQHDINNPDPHCPFRLLNCLVSSLRHISSPEYERCYVVYIRQLTFISCDFTSDLRAIPMLSEVLRFAYRLTHAQLDVCEESVPLTLDILRRHEIIRQPTGFTLQSFLSQDTVLLHLPALVSIRSTSPEIITELLRHRSVSTVAFDDSLTERQFSKILSMTSTARYSHISRLSIHLSITLSRYSYFTNVLHALALAFPLVQHLGLRVPVGMVLECLEVRLPVLCETRSLYGLR